MILLRRGGGRSFVGRGFAVCHPSPFDSLGIAVFVLFPSVQTRTAFFFFLVIID